VTDTTAVIVETVEVVSIESIEIGQQGPPGVPGPMGPAGASGPIAATAFAFGDVSPIAFVTVPAGKMVLEVHVIIETAFDAPDAAISVGDANNPILLMNTNQNNPNEVGYYQTIPMISYLTDTELNLYFTPGTDPQSGSGRFFIIVEG
jgi:hypothetical protein